MIGLFNNNEEEKNYSKGHQDFFEEYIVGLEYTEILKPFFCTLNEKTLSYQSTVVFTNTAGQFFFKSIYENPKDIKSRNNSWVGFSDWIELKFRVGLISDKGLYIYISTPDAGFFYCPYIPLNISASAMKTNNTVFKSLLNSFTFTKIDTSKF